MIQQVVSLVRWVIRRWFLVVEVAVAQNFNQTQKTQQTVRIFSSVQHQTNTAEETVTVTLNMTRLNCSSVVPSVFAANANWSPLCRRLCRRAVVPSYFSAAGMIVSHCLSYCREREINVNNWRAIVQKWVPYLQRYLFNAIPDTNHNANPTNPNRYSKGNPNATNPTNPTKLLTLLTLILDTIVNKAPTSAH